MSDSRCRVLVLLNSLHIGGAEKHSIQLLNKLDDREFALSVRWLKPVESLLPQLDTGRLAGFGCLHVSSKLDWKAVRALTRLMDDSDFDVVLCTNEYPALYASLAARRTRRPPRLVEVFHTTEYARWKERVQMLLYRRILRTFDLLVYVSEQQMRYWRRHGLRAKRDMFIHNGIDCQEFTDSSGAEARRQRRAELGFAAQDYVVAICAALRPEKAHGDFLGAMARLRRRLPGVRGMIIGDGPERARIETAISALGLQEAVRITGFQRDVRPLVSSADVVVLTSHRIETFSIAALEAMALGKPLVLTRIGGAEEQVRPGENGFLYEPGDIDSLCAHLARLADPGLRQSMGHRAGEFARAHFDEAGMLRRYAEQLSRLAQERRAALASVS